MAQKKKSTSSEQKQAAQVKREARRARTERAKAAAEARRKAAQRRQRLISVGIVVAVVAVVAGAYFLIKTLDNSADTSAAPAGATGEFGLALGEADAAPAVVIYEDFLCPACGALEEAVNEPLSSAVEEGQATVEYRPISILGRFGDYSMQAANAFAVVLDAAGPETAKEFHDLLYAEQPSESGPFPDNDWLVEKAVEAGAEESAVRPGIEDLAFEGWVENATDAFSKAGHNSTPTVLVDGQVVESNELLSRIGAGGAG